MFNLGMESDAVNARTLGVHRNADATDANFHGFRKQKEVLIKCTDSEDKKV